MIVVSIKDAHTNNVFHEVCGFSRGCPATIIQSCTVQIGRTERIQNSSSPKFQTAILVDYYFEELQTIKFDLYDVDSTSDALSKHDYLGFGMF